MQEAYVVAFSKAQSKWAQKSAKNTVKLPIYRYEVVNRRWTEVTVRGFHRLSAMTHIASF